MKEDAEQFLQRGKKAASNRKVVLRKDAENATDEPRKQL